MADEEGKKSPNATMQVDALTDVSLVDNVESDDDGDGAPSDAPLDAMPQVSRPPPLPKRKTSTTVILGFIGIVAVTGVLGGLGAHFLVPPAAPPPAPAPPPVASPPPAVEAEAPAEVRHVRLDDEFVIGASEPDAGPPAP